MRWALLALMLSVAATVGFFMHYTYGRLVATEQFELNDRQDQLKRKIAVRLQEHLEKSFEETRAYVLRVMSEANDPMSKGLKIIETSQPEIRRAFYVDQNLIYLPQWQKLRIPKTRENLNLQLAENPDFKLAEILEYQNQDYAGAIKLYEAFWLKNPDDFEAANALARCLFKMQSWERAEKIYRQIYQQNPPPRAPGNMPLALTAAFQLLNLYTAQKQPESTLTFGAEVYEKLINETWELSPATSTFYKNKLREMLGSGLQTPRFRFLRNREQALASLKTYVQFISTQVMPLIENSHVDRYKTLFLSASALPDAFLLIIPYQAGFIVLDINYVLFLQNHLTATLQTFLRDEPLLGFRLMHANERIMVMGTEQGDASVFPVSKQFPDLNLEVRLLPSGTADHSRRASNRLLLFRGGYLGFLFILFLVSFVFYKQLQLAEMKSDFVSHVSHELKTPLTSLRMFSEMLIDQKKLSPAKRHQYHRIMLSETMRLGRLIENLLDLSRIERKKKQFCFRPENIDSIIQSAAHIFQISSPQNHKCLRLHLQAPVMVMADKDALIQMFLNLFDNAKKFSKPHNRIEVGSACSEQKVILRIRDFGIGMSRPETRKVFKKFYQVKRSYADHFKGVGLGLAIVKNIVGAHQGGISLESEPGRGTLITISLPISPVSP
jgi:signal transduction histidine kinase